MFNRRSLEKDEYMLTGSFRKKGYDWWWHSFTAVNPDTGEERPFFLEFFICNPALAKDTPTFGQLPENQAQGIRPSYLMVKAGCWGAHSCEVHRFLSLKDVSIHGRKPFSVSAQDCFLSDTRIKGSVSVSAAEAHAHPEWMCTAGSLSWDLAVDKQISFDVGYGTSRFCRAIKAFEMYWHVAGMKTCYTGNIICNGVRWQVRPDSCWGYADKNWGRGFTSPWVWLSSCHLTSLTTGKALTQSAFDIGGGRPKIYFIALERKLLGAFVHEGEEFEFNFSKFWTGSRTQFSCQETEDQILWHVRQENRHAVMETEVSCNKKDMILVHYEAPDGTRRHTRLWNGGNGTGIIRLYRKQNGALSLIDEIRAENIGCEYGEYAPLPVRHA